MSVNVGSQPGTRFLLKPGEEKKDCFMKGKERDRHAHKHTAHSYTCIFADTWFQALFLSDITSVSCRICLLDYSSHMLAINPHFTFVLFGKLSLTSEKLENESL